MRSRRLPVVPAVLAVLLLAPGAFAAVLEGGPEQQIHVSTIGEQRFPSIAVDAAGNTMVVWNSDHRGLQSFQTLFGRIFDVTGAPRTGELEIAEPGGLLYQSSGKVAADPAGGFVVTWSRADGIFLRRFDLDGQPRGATARISTSGVTPVIAARPAGGFFLVWAESTGIHGAVLDGNALPGPKLPLSAGPDSQPALAIAPGGDALVSWSRKVAGFFSEDVWARLFAPDGQPRGIAFPVNNQDPYQAGYQYGSAVAFHPNGGFSVVWQTVLTTQGGLLGLFGRTFDSAGNPQGQIVRLDGGALPVDFWPPVLAVDPYGRTLLLWAGGTIEDNVGVFGRFFGAGPGLQPLDAPFLANVFTLEDQFEPAAVADFRGGFRAVWSSGSGYPQVLPTGSEGLSSQDGNFYGVFGRRFAGCIPEAGHLCLGAGRFRVEVAWTDHDGNDGTGKAVPLTDDTGSFWFFNDRNLELMLKVLDGRGVNGHFWVFYGALSDVGYTITVTDTVTDVAQSYTNPSGRMASHADVEAFADPIPPPASVAAPLARVSLPLTPPLLSCGLGPESTGLCLGDRFLVSVQFVDPRTGVAGQGKPVALTRDTGVFSFFDGDNLELMVKALDGVPVNNRYWVFYGALSDVEYTITVKDVFTDETRTYHNPAGVMASRADTSAFPLP